MLNAPLSAALGTVLGLVAGSAQAACLSRGSGAGEHFLNVEAVTDISKWISQGAVLVHRTNNMPMCSKPEASCNVSTNDIITVSASDAGQLVLHRSRAGGQPVVRDIARLLPSADGRYLSGFSKGTDGVGQQVFLYYTGQGVCTDSGLDFSLGAKCRTFEFEVFPVNTLQGDRPDASRARWNATACPGVAQQPGSGGGIEPPKPGPTS